MSTNTFRVAAQRSTAPICKPKTLIRDSIVLVLEDFEVLPVDHATRRACLHLADVYGLRKAARELYDLYHNADWKTVNRRAS